MVKEIMNIFQTTAVQAADQVIQGRNMKMYFIQLIDSY